MEQRTDLREIIEYLNPAELEYQEWVDVGMALKHEGYPMEIWDSWSRNDSRYHLGECERKWNTFRGSNSPVTAQSCSLRWTMDGDRHILLMN